MLSCHKLLGVRPFVSEVRSGRALEACRTEPPACSPGPSPAHPLARGWVSWRIPGRKPRSASDLTSTPGPPSSKGWPPDAPTVADSWLLAHRSASQWPSRTTNGLEVTLPGNRVGGSWSAGMHTKGSCRVAGLVSCGLKGLRGPKRT